MSPHTARGRGQIRMNECARQQRDNTLRIGQRTLEEDVTSQLRVKGGRGRALRAPYWIGNHRFQQQRRGYTGGWVVYGDGCGRGLASGNKKAKGCVTCGARPPQTVAGRRRPLTSSILSPWCHLLPSSSFSCPSYRRPCPSVKKKPNTGNGRCKMPKAMAIRNRRTESRSK